MSGSGNDISAPDRPRAAAGTGLTATGIGLTRGGRRVLDQINLALAPGRVTAICGPNGAGKTTLLSTLAGSLAASDGQIQLDGQSLARVGREPLARRRAMLTQGANLPFGFLVAEVVALGRIPHEGRVSSPRQDAIVAQAIEAAGVTALARRNYLTLSGGELQRVQIARCLAQVWEPPADGTARWLLLDEPTSALDLRHQLELLKLLRRLAGAGWGIVVNLHDLAQVRRWADDCVLLQGGQLVACGHATEVITPRRIAEVFEIDEDEASRALGLVAGSTGN